MAKLSNLKSARNGKKRGGFALIFVLGFAAVVTVFTAAIGAEATYNLRLASTRGQTDRAYYAANTGTQMILSLLREPPPPDDFDGNGDVGTWLGEDCSVYVDLVNSQSEAFARVYHNISGFPNATKLAPDDTPIAPDHFYVVSVGVVNGVNDGTGNVTGGLRYEQATMGATLTPDFPILPQAAFSQENIDDSAGGGVRSGRINLAGTVDYFDSRILPQPWVPAINTDRPEASVGTSRTDSAAVVFGPTPKIYGNVFLGHGATVTELNTVAGMVPIAGDPANRPAVASPEGQGEVPQFGTAAGAPANLPGSRPTASVTGRVDALPTDKESFRPDIPADLEGTFPVNYAAGSNLSLKEGKVYRYLGNLNVNSSCKIEVTDEDDDDEIEDAVLLVDGDITFNNSVNNINGLNPPRRLKIYSLDTAKTGTTFRMNGSEAYCLVAGSNMNVEINAGSELWGAVLGKNVTLANAGIIHYDVALRDPNIMASIYGIHIGSSTITAGATLATGSLGPSGPGATGTSGTGTSGTGTSGTGTSGTVGCGCGCGCGGGSMLMAAEQKV